MAKNDYKINSIGFFPCFTSTSCNYAQAFGFSAKFGNAAHGILFRIYLTKHNSPQTHIDTRGNSDDWSFHKTEEEVLIFPHFCFQVVGNTTRNERYGDKEFRLSEITLMEIPFQNQLQLSDHSYISLIWLEEESHKVDHFAKQKEIQESLANVIILHARSEEEALKMLKNSVRSVLVATNDLGSIFIPTLFTGIEPVNNLVSCIIMGETKSAKWAAQYPVVKNVTLDYHVLVESCIKQCNEAIAYNQSRKWISTNR